MFVLILLILSSSTVMSSIIFFFQFYFFFVKYFHLRYNLEYVQNDTALIYVQLNDIIITKFTMVMFLHLSVSHSVHRGGSAVCIQGESASKWGLRPGGWADPPLRILRDTVNERAVRILLECILILILSSCKTCCNDIKHNIKILS